jgi:hypothetical protein
MFFGTVLNSLAIFIPLTSFGRQSNAHVGRSSRGRRTLINLVKVWTKVEFCLFLFITFPFCFIILFSLFINSYLSLFILLFRKVFFLANELNESIKIKHK